MSGTDGRRTPKSADLTIETRRIAEIAREVSDLFQQQLEALGEGPLSDLSDGDWQQYEKRRAAIDKLSLELKHLKAVSE